MSFGRLGSLGSGFGRLGAGTRKASTLLAAPADPTLTLVSGAGDPTPEIDIDGLDGIDSAAVLHWQVATLVDFSDAVDLYSTVGSPDVFSGALDDGPTYIRMRIEWVGHANSDWSNVLFETIDATAPTITSASTVSVAENTTAVLTVTATDAGGFGATPFSLVGGGDSDFFTINAATGVLAFDPAAFAPDSAPNFEDPQDANADNNYLPQVRVTDAAGNATNQTVTVTVTDVVESATFDPANKGTNIVLSNGNLTAINNTTGWASVLSTTSKSTGKHYVEFLLGTVPSGNEDLILIGICSNDQNVNSFITASGNAGFARAKQAGADLGSSGGFSGTQGSLQGYTGVSGDVLSIAIDVNAKKIWVGVNNSYLGDPTAGTSPCLEWTGTLTPLFFAFSNNGSNPGSVTAHPASASQAFSPPTGYTSWG